MSRKYKRGNTIH